ncbi:hypothetical protein BO82DRAFT_360751 [Aspergillus uvarum CBS 121591]|uniref:Uncharacterized protein n=1 Tax=Aspergillus uvarum CBS 121591 TaxID=1448315 RepID=A0A319DEC4_9EURO|nr:hypothetical protein BO82DRAFT_360751 [Aspergillus uvarum CBS 121591]PYH86448.1 hypothetical protein BO82DRAFT_360751 [Aspergillus uvarum CBS 121591]
MPSDLLKPLAVLARQPQSQRCIKAIRNLGDAWHRLTDEPLSELDTKLHTRGNQLRPGPKIQNAQEDQSSLSNPITVEMSTREPLTTPNEEPPVSEPSRHYRILADWGTVFIWRDYDNLRGGEGDCMLEAEEILCSPVYPPSVFEHYGAWVDLYTDSFDRRCNKTGDFHASTFATVAEEVAWNVAR